MIDKDVVIDGLGAIRRFFEIGQPSQAVIFDSYQNIIDGAIELIRDQQSQIAMLAVAQAVEPINSYGTFRCGNCRNIVGYNDGHGRGYQNNFCSKCGKAVKWK